MKHIPNALSGFRVLLIPFFVWQMIQGDTLVAGCILFVSSVTDFLDGVLARKFNWVSSLGKLLDPISDKLTQTAVSAVLIFYLREYWYFFALMIFKDFMVLLLGAILLKQGMNFKGPKFLGKTSTFFFYAGMLLIIFFPKMPQSLTISILVIAVCLAYVSGFLYIPVYFRYKQEIADGQSRDISTDRNIDGADN